jgi:hypothetical protein
VDASGLSQAKAYRSQAAHPISRGDLPSAFASFGVAGVINRGDHQDRIFCDDDNRKMLLATLAEGSDKTGWQIHSYCLITNHLHLLIVTPTPTWWRG